VFPIFDITNIIKKLLLYMTTTRNVYKKMANDDDLSDTELEILKLNNLNETIKQYKEDTLTKPERKMFKVKQAPIKTLNNSLFGALGSGYAFNWSDNVCAGRITTVGRLELRKAIKWFEDYGCKPLLCVTDGINFSIPKETNLVVDNDNVYYDDKYNKPEVNSIYGDKKGVSALIEKFNKEVMIGYMAVDDDGQFQSCLNLKKNNYALLSVDKENNKKVKLTGGMIKNKVMPEYIEDFIDQGLILILEGKGQEFVEYYNSYCEDIFYKRIPLKKIASKKRIKSTIKEYLNRGTDKNGREKAKQAHMELIIEERNELAKKCFYDYYDQIINKYGEEIEKKYPNYNEINVDDFDLEDIYKYANDWMPNEPDLDSTVYLINTGNNISDGDSSIIKDAETGEKRTASSLIHKSELVDNPDMLGDYNVSKYLNDFNKKVKPLLEVFKDDVKDKILIKIKKKRYKDEFGVKRQHKELVKNVFSSEDLQLVDKDLNDLEEAITLEDEEVKFWNKFGYNPYKIWDGFKLNNENDLRYDIYENAFKYLNDKLVESGKGILKRVDDDINEGEYVLLKNKNIFNVGYYDGTNIKIARKNVQIPGLEDIDYEDEVYEYEQEFRKKYGISNDIKLSELFYKQPKAKKAYDDLVMEMNLEINDEEYDF
ncbi:MAG: hypothetical protein ACOC2W_01025, partial [bacterium]